MQQLHLVGFTTDLEGLIFSARKGAKSGGYLVVLDDKLRATVEDALRLRNGQAPGAEGADEEGSGGAAGRPRRPRPESTLSPREIQARLRSGSTIAEVAGEAGVDEEWVSRFAVPIQAEQAQVVGRARRLTFAKARLGESALPLGTAVRWNLADKGIRLFDDDYEAAWSAYNLQGASWVVRFEYTSRQKRQVAEWEVDLREGELLARNRTASELAYVDAARRRRRPPALEPSPRDTPARPAEQARPSVVARGDDEGPSAPARPPAARGSGGARGGAVGGRGGAPASGRSAPKSGRSTVKKAATAAKGRTASAAKKAGKATSSRKAASAKRARPQKPAAKKRGSGDHIAGLGAAKRPPTSPPKAAVQAPPKPPPRPPLLSDEPARPSHLARPPSPMPTARRATTLPLHAPRPVAPRPVALPERPRRPPPVDPDPEAVELLGEAPPESAGGAASRPAAKAAPKPVAPVTDEPPRRAAGEGVRVLGRPERTNGDGPPTAPRRRPLRAVAAEGADETAGGAAGDSPERKLARRLASSSTTAGPQPAGGRTRRPASPAEAEPMWHGPGSGEPAPTVRIRADLAAGTRRPAADAAADAADAGHGVAGAIGGAPAPPAGTRRRERPLRAR